MSSHSCTWRCVGLSPDGPSKEDILKHVNAVRQLMRPGTLPLTWEQYSNLSSVECEEEDTNE